MEIPGALQPLMILWVYYIYMPFAVLLYLYFRDLPTIKHRMPIGTASAGMFASIFCLVQPLCILYGDSIGCGYVMIQTFMIYSRRSFDLSIYLDRYIERYTWRISNPCDVAWAWRCSWSLRQHQCLCLSGQHWLRSYWTVSLKSLLSHQVCRITVSRFGTRFAAWSYLAFIFRLGLASVLCGTCPT
jgi:hypothetical protein